MNDNASLALGGASRSGLGGLPQRLVQDGLVEESAMLAAVADARTKRTSVVTQLVAKGVAAARDIAIAAANEYACRFSIWTRSHSRTTSSAVSATS